jgi:hypothetical protein
MTQTVQPAEWKRQSVPELLASMPAVTEIVRCALQSDLSRRQPAFTTLADGSRSDNAVLYPGMPIAAWSVEHGQGHDHLFAWQADTGVQIGRVWVSRRGAVRFVDDVTRLPAPPALECVFPLGTPTAPMQWPRPPSPFVLRSDEPDQPLDDDGLLEGLEGPLSEMLVKWHARLFEMCKEKDKDHDFKRSGPRISATAWRHGGEETARDEGKLKLKGLLEAKVENFRLVEGSTSAAAGNHQAIRRWQLPFYGSSTYLFEIADRRGLRTRTTNLLASGDFGIAAALTDDTRPIHEFNEKVGDRLKAALLDQHNAAAYLDFFCRFVFGESDEIAYRTLFGLVCDIERDLRWIEPAVEGDSKRLIGLLRGGQAELGVWPLLLGEGPAPADASNRPPRTEPLHYFSALVLFGRELWLCAFKVGWQTGSPSIDMIEELSLSRSVLPVLPQTFDPEARFSLRLRDGQQTVDFEAGGASDPTGSDGWTSTVGAGTPDRVINGNEFIDWILVRDARLPRGPADAPVAVSDVVHLRGRQDVPTSICAFGVHFRGRVDLRETRIAGSLDLSFCIFEDTLLLQDAEIEGSLNLEGASFLGGINLRGAIVHGNLRLESTLIARGGKGRRSSALELSGARVDGDVNLEALTQQTRAAPGGGRGTASEPTGVRMRGTRVAGRLLLGCDRFLGGRVPMVVRRIDAAGARVGSDVSVRGSTVQSPSAVERNKTSALTLDLRDARIGGDFVCGPLDSGWTEPLQRLPFHDMKAEIGPRSVVHFNELILTNARIDGKVEVVASEFGLIDLARATVKGSIELAGKVSPGVAEGKPPRLWPLRVLWGISARGLRVRGNLFAHGVEIHGDFDLIEARIEGMIGLGRSQSWESFGKRSAASGLAGLGLPVLRSIVSGSINLSAARCASHVALDGVVVGGTVRMISANVGALRMLPIFGQASGGDVWPAQIGALAISTSTIGGNLSLPYLQVLGTDDHLSNYSAGVELDNVTVRGNFRTWRVGEFGSLCDSAQIEGWTAGVDPHPWEYSAAIAGDFTVLKSRIGGDCILSLTKISRQLNLSDTVVAGDLMLGSLATHNEALANAAQDIELMRLFGRERPERFQDWRYRAHCADFKARMVRSENDVVLDGMAVRSNVDLTHVQVRGDTLLCWLNDPDANGQAPRPTSESIVSSLQVGGSLDASYGAFNHLTLPLYREHADPRGDSEARADVDLSRCQIETLTTRSGAPAGYQPATFNLGDTDVRVWDISDTHGKPDVDAIASLLGPDASASTWQAVESRLRADGNEDEADRIFRKGKRVQHATRSGRGPDPIAPSADNWERDLARLSRRVVIGVFLLWGVALAGNLLAKSDFVALFFVITAGCLAMLAFLSRPADERVRLRAGVRRLAGRLETWGERLYGELLGYGTRVLPVVMLWLTFVVAAVPIYLASDNFEFSNAALAGKLRNQSDEAARQSLVKERLSWDLGNVGAMIVRNHIPVVDLGALDDWEGKDDKGVVLCVPRHASLPQLRCGDLRWEVHWLSPEGFSTLMRMFNWVLWPVFLTFLTLHLWRRRAS